MAALPKAPSRYNPYKNIELAKFRRDLVLKNLYENNYINKVEYEKLINKKIILKKRKKILLQKTQVITLKILEKMLSINLVLIKFISKD